MYLLSTVHCSILDGVLIWGHCYVDACYGDTVVVSVVFISRPLG